MKRPEALGIVLGSALANAHTEEAVGYPERAATIRQAVKQTEIMDEGVNDLFEVLQKRMIPILRLMPKPTIGQRDWHTLADDIEAALNKAKNRPQ